MMRLGKALVGKKDVTDTGPCKETLRELEEKWRELTEVLGERQSQNRARKQSLNAYEAMREEVTRWLAKMERRLDALEPVAVDLDILRRQAEELKPLSQEHQVGGSLEKTNSFLKITFGFRVFVLFDKEIFNKLK